MTVIASDEGLEEESAKLYQEAFEGFDTEELREILDSSCIFCFNRMRFGLKNALLSFSRQ